MQPLTGGRALLGTLLIFAVGCSKSGIPARSGELWEIDPAAGRPAMPAAALAFAYGLHTFVLDGDKVYAGTTQLTASGDAAGPRTVTLPGGATVTLTAAGTQGELRFANGASIGLRRKAETPETKR